MENQENKDKPDVNIVIPLYNEQDVFGTLVERLDKLILGSSLDIEVIFVDDGSTDQTPQLLEQLSLNNESYQSIFLSRNFGQQFAVTAGLKYVNAKEVVLLLDGDLQDPPEALESFYKYYKKGYDVVYAIRTNRKESWLKKAGYSMFYYLLKRTANISIPINSGDFSLISRRVVDHMNKMNEESRFVRGLRSWVGFRQIGIEIERDHRYSGKSKYSFKKLFILGLNGLFNFSEFPLRFVFTLGFLTLLVSLAYFAYTLFLKLVYDATPQGFTALLFTIILFGGLQLISLGLIGSYVLRIFFQVKNRPLFIVKNRIRRKKTLGKENNF